jgi:hypothetical protein
MAAAARSGCVGRLQFERIRCNKTMRREDYDCATTRAHLREKNGGLDKEDRDQMMCEVQ